MEMTKRALIDICKEHELYRTAELNDKLYCNFKGFAEITTALSAYCNLKALFLEGNALTSLDGLTSLKQLRCLFVQQNLISDLDAMPLLPMLDTLNISNNRIERLSNLESVPNLTSLIAAGNLFETGADVANIVDCPCLLTLDLQNNKIDDIGVVDFLESMPLLRCLYLQGNEAVNMIRSYRRSVVLALKSLTYLDDRPVFDKERRITEAWGRGGIEAERLERQRIDEEERERDRRNFESLQEIRRQGWRKRREALGLSPGDTDPALDRLSSDDDASHSIDHEPPELTVAQERLVVDMIDRADDGIIYLDTVRENEKNSCKNNVEGHHLSLADVE